jgi:hypothetical protein
MLILAIFIASKKIWKKYFPLKYQSISTYFPNYN